MNLKSYKLRGILNETVCNKPECFGRGHDKARSFLCEFSRFDAIFLSQSPCKSFQILFLFFAFAKYPSFYIQLPLAFVLISLLLSSIFLYKLWVIFISRTVFPDLYEQFNFSHWTNFRFCKNCDFVLSLPFSRLRENMCYATSAQLWHETNPSVAAFAVAKEKSPWEKEKAHETFRFTALFFQICFSFIGLVSVLRNISFLSLKFIFYGFIINIKF